MWEKIGTGASIAACGIVIALLAGFALVYDYDARDLTGVAALVLYILCFLTAGVFFLLTVLQHVRTYPHAFLTAKYAVGLPSFALSGVGTWFCETALTPLFVVCVALLAVCCAAEAVCFDGDSRLRAGRGLAAVCLALVLLFAATIALSAVQGSMKFQAAEPRGEVGREEKEKGDDLLLSAGACLGVSGESAPYALCSFFPLRQSRFTPVFKAWYGGGVLLSAFYLSDGFGGGKAPCDDPCAEKAEEFARGGNYAAKGLDNLFAGMV